MAKKISKASVKKNTGGSRKQNSAIQNTEVKTDESETLDSIQKKLDVMVDTANKKAQEHFKSASEKIQNFFDETMKEAMNVLSDTVDTGLSEKETEKHNSHIMKHLTKKSVDKEGNEIPFQVHFHTGSHPNRN